ncbi:hypothetical protein OIO90_001703 [Microbotryomycetes sp. JL221]|nr:hypothetical protein OIO90_001703 [Microbotryomycetes sp. JL221]
MATVASPPQTGTRQSTGGTQKRLLRSISRFLSGSKTQKPRNGNEASPPSPELHRTAQFDEPVYTTTSTSSRIDQPQPHQQQLQQDGRPSTRRVRSGTGNLSYATSLTDTFDDEHSLSRLSALSGADTDASVRPISPSSHAGSSSVISRTDSASNASLAPTQGTFKSYASTKPTTLSVDSGGGTGANRIAVVPGTGVAPGIYQPSTTTRPMMPNSSSGNSLSNVNTSGPGITFDLGSANATSAASVQAATNPTSPTDSLETTKVPRHTQAHPRNNPHPASPPPDNASMLTLASSSFAPSISRNQAGDRRGAGSTIGGADTPNTATTPGAAVTNLGSHFGGAWQGGGLNSLRAWKQGDGQGADEDASVRVLTGSRRASDESLGGTSTWSAAIGRASRRDNAAPSIRTVGTTGTGGDLVTSALDKDENAALPASVSGDLEAAKIVQEAKIGEVQAATPRSDLTPTEEFDVSPSLSAAVSAKASPQLGWSEDVATPLVGGEPLAPPVLDVAVQSTDGSTSQR